MSSASFSRRNDRAAGSARPSEPGEGGFTLLELLLATSLAVVVTALVAGALGLGLKAWDKLQGEERDVLPLLADLMARQAMLLYFEPAPLVPPAGPGAGAEDGAGAGAGDETPAGASGEEPPGGNQAPSGGTATEAVARGASSASAVTGSSDSLRLVTTCSVRALTPGGPVKAEYIFDREKKSLSYKESPYQKPADGQESRDSRETGEPQAGTKDAKTPGASEQGAPEEAQLGTSIPLDEFSLSYLTGQGEVVSEWGETSREPVAIILKASGGQSGRSLTRWIYLGALNFGAKAGTP